MKTMQSIFIIGFLIVGCSTSSVSEHKATAFLPGSLQDNWIVTSSSNSETFKPLRGLNNALTQITLVNNSENLKRELSPGKIKTFHPSLVLLVFDFSELQHVEQAVVKESSRSDFPPIIFGQTNKHIFVTSPGYINQGLHTADAEAIIEKLKTSLKAYMEIR